MELSWINKLRIGLVAALGIIVIGFFCWPLAAPRDPMAPVRSIEIGFLSTLVLVLVAFVVSIVAYFIAWPHGREMGILAVPFGLCLWGVRSGPMAVLNQAANTAAKRTEVLNSLLLEPLYWLVIVAAGFLGVLAAQRLSRKISASPSTDGAGATHASPVRSSVSPKMATTLVVAVMVSVIVAQFFLTATAKDIPPFNGIAATQPPNGQIAFAVMVAFAAAGFVAKQFLGLSYILPTIASAFLVPFAQIAYHRSDSVEKFTSIYPATFFANSTLAILPLQLVAFGAIGSVMGYWLALRYRYWRTHPTA
jgi:hypothetical protein